MIRLRVVDPIRFVAQLDTYERRYLKPGDNVRGETPGANYLIESIDDEGQAVMMITVQRKNPGGCL